MSSTRLWPRQSHHILLILGIIFFTSNVANAQIPAANRIWTTVGSAGTVDETDGSKIFFDHGTAQIGQPLIGPASTPTATAGQPTQAAQATTVLSETASAVIRYNITPVDGQFAAGGAIEMNLRYLDVGRDAQVFVELIEVDFATGGENVRVKFDSNTVTGANGYHTVTVNACAPPFDYVRKGYYVNVKLTHSAIIVGSAAGIQMIKVKRIPCSSDIP